MIRSLEKFQEIGRCFYRDKNYKSKAGFSFFGLPALIFTS
jgi:hypothetical protein